MIIGFCGLIGSGKTAAARHLIERHGFARRRFAQPLRAMLRAIGLTDRHLDGDLKTVPCDLLCGAPPRYAMQTLGTEWGRELIGPDFWVSTWAAGLSDLGHVVADDVRFPNEAAAIKARRGYVVRIVRPGVARQAHVSENADLPADLEIINDGTLDDLARRIDYIFEPLLFPSSPRD